jgi:hypothetical protein
MPDVTGRASFTESIKGLPPPFREQAYRLLQKGVYDSPETDVYVNQAADFAFLHPRPQYDYVYYKSRVLTLNLEKYKKTLPVVQRRYEKIAACFESVGGVLEVGAADGSFLAHVATRCSGLTLASLEVDENTRPGRDALPGLRQYESFDAVRRAGERYEIVCLFHVLEHVFEPGEFLADCVACLAPGGRLIVEVPSLDDPLLSLYDCEAYRRFYFQRQHPYVYSARSMTRLLERLGFEVERPIHHQRYGLENHLGWLSSGKPGGSERLREVLSTCENEYMRCLEQTGRTDSFIAVARPAARG